MQRKRTHVLRHTLWNTFEHYCKVTKFETMVDTLIEYVLDGDTLIIRIQCSVFEVL